MSTIVRHPSKGMQKYAQSNSYRFPSSFYQYHALSCNISKMYGGSCESKIVPIHLQNAWIEIFDFSLHNA